MYATALIKKCIKLGANADKDIKISKTNKNSTILGPVSLL
jgi:hypothetical protein